MKMTDLFLAQLERETPATRAILARVPEGKNDWKPHPRSMSLGDLSALVASMSGWIVSIIEKDHLDIGKGEGAPSRVRTSRELVEVFDKSAASARRALSNTTDEHLKTKWQLRFKDRVLTEQPRDEMILDGVFSHLAHHRGQLSVYLRLNEVPVPPIYGATADEGR